MKRTYFERNFLELNKHENDPKVDKDIFDANVVVFFHDLLLRVNKGGLKDWNINLLRSYIDAFYAKSENSIGASGNSVKNIFTISQSQCDMSVFYTGLSEGNTKDDRLFILYIKKSVPKLDFWERRKIVSRKRLIELCGLDPQIDLVVDDFEKMDIIKEPNIVKLEEFCNVLGDKNRIMEHIEKDKEILVKRLEILDRIVYSDFDFLIKYKANAPEFLKYESKVIDMLRASYNSNVKGPNIMLHGWMHILIDGVDNLPSSFFSGMFDLRSCDNVDDYYYRQKVVIGEVLKEKPTVFLCYCKIMQRVILYALQKIKDGKGSFPRTFYKQTNRKEMRGKVKYTNDSNDNFILPISLLGNVNPEFCLVIDAKKNIFKTVLNLDEIYADMRVLGEKMLLKNQEEWHLWPSDYFNLNYVKDL